MKEAPTKLVSDILTLMAKRMSDHDDQQFSDSELAEIVDLVVAGTRNDIGLFSLELVRQLGQRSEDAGREATFVGALLFMAGRVLQTEHRARLH
ncbi:MAG: hypothetical protein ACYSR5_11270 [Planctomycetota bacterium]|jgi:hypothetical protein